MRITDVDVLTVETAGAWHAVDRPDSTQRAAIVRIASDNGLVGYGQAEGAAEVMRAVVDAPAEHELSSGLRVALLGQNPLHLTWLWRRMYHKSLYFGRHGAAVLAMSGVDLALHDLVGKALGVPVYQLLGGRCHNAVSAYASVLMPDTPDEVAALVDDVVRAGFVGVKLGWGPLGDDPRNDVRLVEAARDAAGADVRLMIDVGFRWETARRACDMTERLAKYDLTWVEEPLHPDDRAGYRRLCASSAVAIAAGEESTAVAEFLDLARDGVDVLQPDVMRCGGLTAARTIAALAEINGVRVVPHCWNTGLGRAATVHLLASLHEPALLEYCLEETEVSTALTGVPDIGSAGTVRVRDEPGLGVLVDEEKLLELATTGIGRGEA
ncbi:mandelate racemase/muconate lactonizing enzyme family protein [Lentzea sp. NPDC051208]|uniref:mandelate racemase/muconate lactonizing enzyme family protein n=1 Tax=Lentzea sp. NPDC051208 TaxID=3154642 RepID=UPI00342DCF8E